MDELAGRSEFEDLHLEIRGSLTNVEGWMDGHELELLALLAAYPTTTGLVLEIGSYRGRSTIALAKGAKFAGDPAIVAVDPLPNSGHMIPDEKGKPSARAMFDANLVAAGVDDCVEFHQLLSSELADSWDRPIRLLWIDGDHTYRGAKADYDQFCPFLSDGAIVAIHDVLSLFEGPVRVFSDILLSPNFGPSGMVGSIGWAQFFRDPEQAVRYRDRNVRLYSRLSRLIPYVAFNRKLNWLQRRIFRLARLRVPHRRFDVAPWIKSMQSAEHGNGSVPIKLKSQANRK